MTRREGVAGGGAAWRGGASLLPGDLAGEYRFVRQLAAVGGEAVLLEVESRAGDRRIVKLYHEGVRLRLETLRRVQSVDRAHVVELVDFGQLVDGRWYEVQERIDGGNLVEFRRSLRAAPAEGVLKEILAEISEAIAALHGVGLAHHDIKPENILLRSDSPLNLVLSDFGLTVVADSRTYYATNRHATINYQAPETMRQIGGEPRDYWALGLTMAMLATGDVPYAGLSDHAILDQHHKRIPPPLVESLPDGRLKELCRGLTRYDPQERWSIDELRSWLRGNNPELAPESQRPASGLEFNRRVFSQPSELAAELLANQSLAAATIGIASRRQQFMDQLILVFGTEALGELDGHWHAEPPRRDNVDVALVELIVALDPDHDAHYGDRPLTPDTIAAAALGDSEDDHILVDILRRQQILQAWARSPKHAALGEIDQRWRTALSRAEEIISQVQPADDTAVAPPRTWAPHLVDWAPHPLGRAEEIISQVQPADDTAVAPPLDDWVPHLLAVCASPELRDEWQHARRTQSPTGEHLPPWYQNITQHSTEADIVAGVLLAGEAERIQQLGTTRAEQTRLTRRFERLGRKSRWISGLALIAAGILEWQAGTPLSYLSLLGSWAIQSTGTKVLLGFIIAFTLIWFTNRSPQSGAFGWIVAVMFTVTLAVILLDSGFSPFHDYRFLVFPPWILMLALLRQWKKPEDSSRAYPRFAEFPGAGLFEEFDSLMGFLLATVLTLLVWVAWTAWLLLVSLGAAARWLSKLVLLRQVRAPMDLSHRSRRRTELCSITAAVAIAYWFAVPDYQIADDVLYVIEGGSSDAFWGYSVIAYGVCAASALWGSVLSFTARRREIMPSDQPIGMP